MKILFNASMYSDNPTGVGVYTKNVWNNLYKKLADSNIEYKIFAYSKDGLKKEDDAALVKLPPVFDYLLKKFMSLHRLVWNLFYLPFISKRFDLVYSFSTHGSPFIKKQIITIHDLICFTYPKQHKFQFLYFKYILPSVLRSCFKIIVISEFTKREVLKHFNVSPEKIIVISNGGDHLLNTGKIYLSENDKLKFDQQINKNPFFLTVGASYPHKNIPRLIEAMQNMPEDILLVVVGIENKYYKSLEQIAKDKKMKNVIFLSYVSPALLNELYKKCLANVYISLYEGFGFPPFEAALNNRVSVLSNAGALPEIYKNAAIFVNPLDIDEIAKALKNVSAPEFNKEYFLEYFMQLKSAYTWSKTSEEIKKVILTLPK